MSEADQEPNVLEQTQSTRQQQYILKLFIAGHTTRSVQAINTIKTLCTTYLQENYVLEVVDIYLNPDAAEAEGIITLPTLLCKQPLPQRKLIGDLSDEKKLCIWLGLEPYN